MSRLAQEGTTWNGGGNLHQKSPQRQEPLTYFERSALTTNLIAEKAGHRPLDFSGRSD
jgi:hypothetical protein